MDRGDKGTWMAPVSSRRLPYLHWFTLYPLRAGMASSSAWTTHYILKFSKCQFCSSLPPLQTQSLEDSCYRDPHSPSQRTKLPAAQSQHPLPPDVATSGSSPTTLRCLTCAPCLNWAATNEHLQEWGRRGHLAKQSKLHRCLGKEHLLDHQIRFIWPSPCDRHSGTLVIPGIGQQLSLRLIWTI